MTRSATFTCRSVGHLALVLAMLAPVEASAQLGWVKRLFGRGPAPTAPSTPAAPAAESSAPTIDRTPSSLVQPSQTIAIPVAPAQVGAQEAAAQAASLAQKEELDRLIGYGRVMDARPPSLENANERVRFWQGMKLRSLTVEVQERYDVALRDLQELTTQDSLRKASDAKTVSLNRSLDRATQAFRTNSFSDVESIADDILATDPTNQRALMLKERAAQGEKLRRLRYTLLTLGAAAVALFVVLGVFAKKIFKRDREAAATPAAAGGKAYIKVIDGVARGKLISIKGEVFRIGATAAGDEDDHNDLVISDSLGAVSRYHCSILRKGKDYFLIDASRNGTRLNDKVLARGGNHRLRDGDEFIIADVSRLKFVRT